MADKQGGFECEFVEKPPKAIQSECPVCLLVLREPYQATCCGYSFCRACIERIKERNNSCPCCKADEFDHYPNKGLQRSLNEFKVQCSNKHQGCQWEGELGQLDNHLNYNPTKDKQLEGCQFAEIECFQCSVVFLRSQIQAHQSDQCPRRSFSCQYCKDYDSTYEDVTINHWLMCGYYPMPCPNKCGETLQRQNLDSHITNDCPLTIIDCDFLHVGCEVRLPRNDMSAHLEDGVVCHLSLQTGKCKKDMKRLEEENKEIKQQIVTSINLGEELRQQVAKLTQDLQMQQICTPLCPVEFTITDFEQKRKDKKSWQSPPFYTHLKGYKMCLYVYANGLVIGKRTHVSVYIKLMKGEFDNQLKWPFLGKVEIQLLNQDKIEGHYTITFNFSESVAGRAGERVTEGEESEIIYGNHKFISHGDLQTKYLKNDCLRFRIKNVL